MNLIIMKVLKFAVILLSVASPLLLGASDEVTFDLERISTENGKVYRDILILDSDRHGLLFRHANGIAKIDFGQLSMNLRMLYEPVGEVPEEMPEESVKWKVNEELSRFTPVTMIAKTKVTIPLHRGYFDGSGWRQDYRRSYSGWWPRYQPALRLAVPYCRALAVEDFLITTGLVPRPFGVQTYRLPYNRADLLY